MGICSTKKYELTAETRVVFGTTLFRIIAKTNFDGINKGDLGGFIESENNLSHKHNAWVSGDAMVFGSAEVFGNARVYGDARVSDNAWVSGDARVSDKNLINIIGLKWNITITDKHIQIGCEIKTISEWKGLPDRWLKRKYPNEVSWWNIHKDAIFSLADNRIGKN